MSNTIKGIVLEFTAAELNDHCKKREQYHLALTDKYTKSIQKSLNDKANAAGKLQEAAAKAIVEPIVDEESEDEDFGGKGGYARMSNAVASDTSSDERKLQSHRRKLKFFRALQGHFVTDKKYRLSTNDLDSLELV